MSPEELQILLDGPALARPHDVPAGALNDGEHSIGYALAIFPSVLCTIAVAIRLGSRLALRKFGIEDVFVIFALGMTAGHAYLLYEASISPGIFIHQWNLQLRYFAGIQFKLHIGSILYGLIVMCLRIAILVDWLRLFIPTGQRGWLFWTLHGLIWSNVVIYGTGTPMEIWRCHPREKIWNPLFEGGSCPVDFAASNLSSAVINVISDLAILIVPQWVIWNLHISRSRRIGVSLLFVIGLFACVCATVRLYYVVRTIQSLDMTYYISYVILWGIGEITVGFLIIGIPSVPAIVRVLPISDSVASLLQKFRRSNEKDERQGNGYWPRVMPRKRHDQWEISALDTRDLVTTTTLEMQEIIATQPDSLEISLKTKTARDCRIPENKR